jgi:hypothetical protein
MRVGPIAWKRHFLSIHWSRTLIVCACPIIIARALLILIVSGAARVLFSKDIYMQAAASRGIKDATKLTPKYHKPKIHHERDTMVMKTASEMVWVVRTIEAKFWPESCGSSI